ncbi:hypothetical protein KIN20_000534 [Parelaphostrongylus tenuis]|uniref:Uncharacterized protein n=1 Tax=Parelaphostrongylus tenuis TaxID=148309 RepID=A0AAD5MDT1_PARTN|nr:hypothetical protein KIN20_000534 [Parelaphostrongylus tenuis]
MGIVVIALTTLIVIKLRAIRQKPHPYGAVNLREKRFKQAAFNGCTHFVGNKRQNGWNFILARPSV